MKKIIPILLAVVFLVCAKLPNDPAKLIKPWTIFIEHLGTEYVEADLTVDGLISTKVNVLTFGIRSENFNPKALEFYGRAVLYGPPENREHAIHFRTDTITMEPTVTGFTFNTQEWISPGIDYTFNRAKFPTNEYSPFQGLQGKVKEVTITDAWALNENNVRFSIVLGETTASR